MINDEFIEKVKLALRIDSGDEDTLTEMCIRSAFIYLKNAVGPDECYYIKNEQAELAITMLTDHYYRVRSATTDGKKAIESDLGLQTIILQMKPAYRIFMRKKESD